MDGEAAGGDGLRDDIFLWDRSKAHWKKKLSLASKAPGPRPPPLCWDNTADDRASFPHSAQCQCASGLACSQHARARRPQCPLPTVEMAFDAAGNWPTTSNSFQAGPQIAICHPALVEGRNRAICPSLAKHLSHMSGLPSELLMCLELSGQFVRCLLGLLMNI